MSIIYILTIAFSLNAFIYIYIFIWFHFTFHNYFFCKKCYRSRVVESMYAHVSYFPHLRNWNVQF